MTEFDVVSMIGCCLCIIQVCVYAEIIISGLCVPKSVVMTVYNASRWLDDNLQSILAQTFAGTLELSIYNDGSTVSDMCTGIPVLPYMESNAIRTLQWSSSLHMCQDWRPAVST